MSDRRAQIVSLLGVRFEGFPEPHRRVEYSAGFVHHTRAPQVCPICEGVESYGCTGCGGRGEVEVLRERDPMAVDKVQPYGLTPDRREAEAARDRQIVALERQTRPARDVDEVAEANSSPWPWERARARLYRDYHLRELDRAIEALRAGDEDAWHALSMVYVAEIPDTSTTVAAAAERGMRFLEERLPDPLRAPGAVEHPATERQRTRRDAA